MTLTGVLKNIAGNGGVSKDLELYNSFGVRIRCKHTSPISVASLTFRLLFQAGMWARGWVWEAIAVYDL